MRCSDNKTYFSVPWLLHENFAAWNKLLFFKILWGQTGCCSVDLTLSWLMWPCSAGDRAGPRSSTLAPLMCLEPWCWLWLECVHCPPRVLLSSERPHQFLYSMMVSGQLLRKAKADMQSLSCGMLTFTFTTFCKVGHKQVKNRLLVFLPGRSSEVTCRGDVIN